MKTASDFAENLAQKDYVPRLVMGSNGIRAEPRATNVFVLILKLGGTKST